jgi:di/tricarboxylate transporter
MFNLIPEYLPGILVLIACASLGIAPTNVILSGFSSETFILVFSVLAMTILIARSGLIPRFILTLLKFSPKRKGQFNSVFFISFAFLTPFIPSIISRAQLVGKSVVDFTNMFELKNHEDQITKLAVSAFFGTSLFSNVFLSASLMNFIILALLPLQEQLQFQLSGWLEASFVAFLVMLVSYVFLFNIFFKGGQTIQIQKKVVEKRLDDLGPISRDEWMTISVIAIFSIGMISFPYHKISPTWIAFGIVYVLLAFNVLSREEILSKVDWLFLLLMAGVIGISSVMSYFNISGAVSEKLMTFTSIFKNSSGFLFMFFVISTIIIRFFLPIGATIALLAPLFIALSGLYGVTAWAACFTCLMVTDMWFFKYQCTFFTPMTNVFKEAGIVFDEKKFLTFNAIANVVRILAIFASFYYWHWLGL